MKILCIIVAVLSGIIGIVEGKRVQKLLRNDNEMDIS